MKTETETAEQKRQTQLLTAAMAMGVLLGKDPETASAIKAGLFPPELKEALFDHAWQYCLEMAAKELEQPLAKVAIKFLRHDDPRIEMAKIVADMVDRFVADMHSSLKGTGQATNPENQ